MFELFTIPSGKTSRQPISPFGKWGMARQRARQILLSMPHYFGELGHLRHPRDLSAWIYYKFPYAFPLRSFPTYVTVEFTNICNFGCKHCWRSTMVRPQGTMEVGVFEKIMDELRVRRPAVLKLGGLGEPSLHPRFSEMMALVARETLPTMLYTNGTVFRIFPHGEILSWGLDSIVVSVDGIDGESYERTKLGGNYAALRKEVAEFYGSRESAGPRKPRVEIRHIIMPNEGVNEILHFRKAWLGISDTVKFNYLEPATGLADAPDPTRPKCRFIRREMSVQWDGRVPLCGGYRGEYVGSVKDFTLAELWRHPRKEHLRRCHERADFAEVPLCMRCLRCR